MQLSTFSFAHNRCHTQNSWSRNSKFPSL